MKRAETTYSIIGRPFHGIWSNYRSLFIFLLWLILMSFPVQATGQSITAKSKDSITAKAKDTADEQDVLDYPFGLSINDYKGPPEPEGLLNKILQVFKFKQNKEEKQKERFNKYLKDELDTVKLVIDAPKVEEIEQKLDSIMAIYERVQAIFNEEKNETISEVLQKAFLEHMKEEMDSIQELLSRDSLLRIDSDLSLQDKLKFDRSLNAIYSELQEVKYGKNSVDLAAQPLDSTLSKDSTAYHRFRSYLKRKKQVQIIGWHNGFKKRRIEDYKYNFLSAINYHGLEIQRNGETSGPSELGIDTVLVPRVIADAKRQGIAAYLTLFSDQPNTITSFLNNEDAQNSLIRSVMRRIDNKSFNGINLYFSFVDLRQKDKLTEFVRKIKSRLVEKDTSNRLVLTLPGIRSRASLSHAKAYDFGMLDPSVDLYLIQTDKLADLEVKTSGRLPQSASPLANQNDPDSGTIQSIVDYYLDQNVPKKKLVITLSYAGIQWDVNQAAELVKGTRGKRIPYSEILDRIKRLREFNIDPLIVFDSVQVTSYLDYMTRDNESNIAFREIWYDDPRSLGIKYKWVLDNELGGVSLRYLNDDDGSSRFGEQYQKLWKTLGAAMLEVDMFHVDTVFIKSDTAGISLRNKIKIFMEDFQWAVTVRLVYWDKNKNRRHCEYDEQEIKKLKKIPDKEIIWRYTQDFEKYTIDNQGDIDVSIVEERNWFKPDVVKIDTLDIGTYNVLKSKNHCTCLYARWKYYSNWIGYFFILLSISLAVISAIIWNIIVNHPENKSLSIYQRIRVYFIVPLLLFFGSLFIYLAPYSKWIGAGSEGSNFWLLLTTLIVGTLIGILYYEWAFRRRFAPKDMP